MEIEQLELKLKVDSPMKTEWDKDGNDNEIGTEGHIKGISARGPKIIKCLALIKETMIWMHFFIDLKFMLIAKDGKK